MTTAVRTHLESHPEHVRLWRRCLHRRRMESANDFLMAVLFRGAEATDKVQRARRARVVELAEFDFCKSVGIG